MNNSHLQSSIYKNASMGEMALRSLIPMVGDSRVKNVLISQYNGYKAQKEMTALSMKKMGLAPQGPSLMSQLMTSASVKLKMKRDGSSENAAKMVIKGTNTGIIELTETLNHTRCSSPETVQSAKEYLRREQKNIEKLKPYL